MLVQILAPLFGIPAHTPAPPNFQSFPHEPENTVLQGKMGSYLLVIDVRSSYSVYFSGRLKLVILFQEESMQNIESWNHRISQFGRDPFESNS